MENLSSSLGELGALGTWVHINLAAISIKIGKNQSSVKGCQPEELSSMYVS